MELLSSLRFSFRLLRKRWGLSLASIFTLGLCIGLNVAFFSVLYGLLWRSLPLEEPGRVMEIYNTYPGQGFDKAASNPQLYTVYGEAVNAFEAVALEHWQTVTLGEDSEPERLTANLVTPEFFSLLGIPMRLGRDFTPEMATPGNDLYVILTDRLWRDRFGGDPNIIDTPIQMSGRNYTVIGVLPPTFAGYDNDARLFLPWAWNPTEIDLSARHLNWAMLLGRLKPGATVAEAQAQVDAIDRAYYDTNPDAHEFLDLTAHRTEVASHVAELRKPYAGTLWALLAGVAAILVIGCLNVGSLQIAQAMGRRQEFALRRSLGASQGRLGRQVLGESLFLAALGGIVGLLLAALGVWALKRYLGDLLPNPELIHLDFVALLATSAIVLGAGILFGLYPLFGLARRNFLPSLNEGQRTSSLSRSQKFFQSTLLVTQVGLIFVLLVGAGLLLRSFTAALQVDPGFDLEDVHTLRLSLSDTKYPEAPPRRQFAHELLERVRALPGVESAALGTTTPFRTGTSHLTFSVFGEEPLPNGEMRSADNFFVSDGFFATMGIPLQRGHDFNRSDNPEQVRYIVDEELARRFLPQGLDGALDTRLTFDLPPENLDEWPRVVGVSAPIKIRRLTTETDRPLIFRWFDNEPGNQFSLFVRSPRQHADLVADLRRVIRDLDPATPIFLSGTMDHLARESLSQRRGVLALVGLFALGGLILTLVGIYGALSYRVAQERRELGIRAALGADRDRLLRRVLWQGAFPVLLGLVIGLIGALFGGRLLESYLFGVKARDPLTLVALVALLSLFAFLAIWIPARRAASLDPARVLRDE